MQTKIFGDKKIIIRKLSKEDLRKIKKFQDFINSFVEEDAQISLNKKLSLKEEKEWLNRQLKQIKNRKTVFLVAEDKNTIVGTTGINLGVGRQSHIGNFGITVRTGYRGIGLGTYLTREVLTLVKKELKPKPKIIQLNVFPDNRPALGLYNKIGFKEVARVPKQLQYKGKLVDEIIMFLEL